MFDELDRALGIDYNPNAWSDNVMFYVRDLIDRLSDDEWAHVEGVWKERPSPWQVRLAQAAFAATNGRTIDLLRKMLTSPIVDVALAAAETLGEEAQDKRWMPDGAARSVLQMLLGRVDSDDRHMIEALLAYAPTS